MLVFTMYIPLGNALTFMEVVLPAIVALMHDAPVTLITSMVRGAALATVSCMASAAGLGKMVNPLLLFTCATLVVEPAR